MGTPAWYQYIYFVPAPNDAYLWLVIVAGFITWCAAWGIGANDTANSWGSTVGAKGISVRNAAILAGIFEVTGAFALGANVGGTLKSKIVEPQAYCYDNYSLVVRMVGMASVDVGSAIWLFVCSRFGIPVSTTHAAVGGVTGFGIASRGWGSVVWWETLGKIFISWASSPLLSCFVAFVLQWLTTRFLFRGKPGSIYRKNHLFVPLLSGLFLGVAAVFAYYIGGKSNNQLKGSPAWTYGVTFGAVAAGMMIILSLVAWYLRRRWKVDLHEFDEPEAEARAVEDGEGDNLGNLVDTEDPAPTLPTTPTATPAVQNAEDDVPEPFPLYPVYPETSDQAETRHEDSTLLDDSKDEKELSVTLRSSKKATFYNGEKMNNVKDIYEGVSKEVIAANRLWIPLCWIVAATESFAHGANDVGNAIGPYAALIDSYNNACPKGTSDIPYWIMGLGASGILVGLITYGHKVIRTLGVDIAVITPQRAAISEMGTVLTVLIATALEIPVSTTHCAVGAITGMALNDGFRAVNWRTILNVVLGIVVTVPACCLMTTAVFSLWTAAVFGPTYPGPFMFNKYCNTTYPGPWKGQSAPPKWKY